MTMKAVAKVVCLLIIGLPNAVAGVQGITLPPSVQLGLTVLAAAAGLVLSELEPGWRKPE